MLTFNSVSWQNFLATGNAPLKIDLTKAKNTIIQGKNGAGKSTFIDALTYCLFGKPYRKISLTDLVNTDNGKGMVTTVEFVTANGTYKVVRGQKPKIFEIYANGKLIDQSAAAKDYQAILENTILKMNYKTFTQVQILGAAKYVPFMRMTASERRLIIEDILDIQVFSLMNEKLKERMGALKTQEPIQKLEIARLTDKVALLQKHLQENTTNIQDEIDAATQEGINNIELLDKYDGDLSIAKSNAAACETILKDATDTIDAFTADHNAMNVTRKAKVKELRTTLDFFKDHDECYLCKQGIRQEHKSKMIEDATFEIDRLNEPYKPDPNKLEHYQNATERHKTYTGLLAGFKAEITNLETQIAVVKAANKALRTKILALKNRQSSVDKTELTNAQGELALAQANYDLLVKQLRIYETTGLMLKDTGIKTQIIKQYLPTINKSVNKYIQKLGGLNAKFEFDENFSEQIRRRHLDPLTYESFSEGEKQRIDLSLLMTWRDIGQMKGRVNCSLLILDEIGDSSLDSTGVDALLSLLQGNDKMYKYIISHKTDTPDSQVFDRLLTFKTNKGYTVMQEDLL